jgi:hypothetical protein
LGSGSNDDDDRCKGPPFSPPLVFHGPPQYHSCRACRTQVSSQTVKLQENKDSPIEHGQKESKHVRPTALPFPLHLVLVLHQLHRLVLCCACGPGGRHFHAVELPRYHVTPCLGAIGTAVAGDWTTTHHITLCLLSSISYSIVIQIQGPTTTLPVANDRQIPYTRRHAWPPLLISLAVAQLAFHRPHKSSFDVSTDMSSGMPGTYVSVGRAVGRRRGCRRRWLLAWVRMFGMFGMFGRVFACTVWLVFVGPKLCPRPRRVRRCAGVYGRLTPTRRHASTR